MCIKIKFLILLLLFGYVEVYSQKVIGLQAGANFSSLQFEEDAFNSPEFGIGLKLGVNYLYRINNSFDLESGLFFSQKGQKNKNNGSITGNIEEFETYNLNYLQIPLTLDYNFNKSIFISGGIYFAYGLKSYYSNKMTLIDSKTKEVIKETTEKEELSSTDESQLGSDVERTLKKIDFGLSFGIGYRFSRLTIKSEFDLGLTPSIKVIDPFIFHSTTEEFKNRSLSLSLIYYISDNYYHVRY